MDDILSSGMQLEVLTPLMPHFLTINGGGVEGGH